MESDKVTQPEVGKVPDIGKVLSVNSRFLSRISGRVSAKIAIIMLMLTAIACDVPTSDHKEAKDAPGISDEKTEKDSLKFELDAVLADTDGIRLYGFAIRPTQLIVKIVIDPEGPSSGENLVEEVSSTIVDGDFMVELGFSKAEPGHYVKVFDDAGNATPYAYEL